MMTISRKAGIAIGAAGSLVLILVLAGGTMVWAHGYDGRIGPNTFVGRVEVSGMRPEAARAAVRGAVDALLAEGAPILVEGNPVSLPLSIVAESDAVDAVTFDADGAVAAALGRVHGGNDVQNAWSLLLAAFGQSVVPVNVVANRDVLLSAIQNAQPDMERPPQNASFTFSQKNGTWSVEAVEGSAGDAFDMAAFQSMLMRNLSMLSEEPTALTVTHRNPDVSGDDARALTERAREALERAPFVLSAGDDSEPEETVLSAEDLAVLIAPSANGLDVDAAAFERTMDPIADAMEVLPKNARFERDGDRVTEFAGSSSGVAVNREQTRTNLVAALNGSGETRVTVSLVTVEPEVKTEEVNDLGITDMLGTGTSSYRGSPGNRVKNIANGVALLNGLLIAPDETFSLLTALKPFETANGYLPELVIKGDKIQPEIGGGLCQIGTTTFRAALNSGLPINERSNHSLVVSYYNDPSNGNPGTDATIYDPAPDLKFTNDTGHFVLFEAEMLTDEQGLRFTFWGTSDGRRGSYSPPVVDRWIPVGNTIMTETLTLPPGEKKCQAAHVGADTHFTYSVVKPDGTSVEQLFSSHYRPLPEICLVGVEQLSTPDALQPPADGVSSTQTSDAPAAGDASQTDQEQKQN